VVNNVSYNAANQLLTIDYPSGNETRSYNALNQLTNLAVGTTENLTYNYPTSTNNGKISSMYNAVSGETVTYTYDSLNRLLTANGSGWGEQYGFDGFGNLLSKTVTAGSGPSLSQAVNTANNQIVGQSYDANGNTTTLPTNGLTYNPVYDGENRETSIYFDGTTLISYFYDAQNRRIWSWPGTMNGSYTSGYTVNAYSTTGQKLGAYSFVASASLLTVTLSSSDQYFGSRRLAVVDQLGSAGIGIAAAGTYYPWGELKGSTNPQDTWSYATYWQDSVSGLDYANNRYYSNAYGRFMTPDPSRSSGGPSNPQSWNRYSYTAGDPVNRNDPAGLDYVECGEGEAGCTNEAFIGFNQGWGGYCDPSQANCGNACVAPDGFTQMPSPSCSVSGGGYQPPTIYTLPPPPVITLRVIDECIYPNGIGISMGSFTLEVEYQVLVNGQPLLGNYSLSNAGVNRVNETVTNTGGNVNYGSGSWCLSTATCDMPGSLTSSGTFWDSLSGGGTANQSFTINGQAIAALFPGTVGLKAWQDVFNSKSVSVGNGAVTGNSSTRICGSKHGDPSTN
jgi:RHS repeat-associated protein